MAVTNDTIDSLSLSRQTYDDLGAILSPHRIVSQSAIERLRDADEQLNLIALANQYWLIGAVFEQLNDALAANAQYCIGNCCCT